MRALHTLGPRSGKRLVTVNCSAVVETLSESELFGHVRGAFTGANDNKTGLFETADGATLFLDEIGELPLPVQAKLLRVIENGEVQRVGSIDTRTVDVRIVAATNRDLRAEVAAGRFRGDLYYRLNIAEVMLPPLRDRREDVPYLTAVVRSSVRRALRQDAERSDAGRRADARPRPAGTATCVNCATCSSAGACWPAASSSPRSDLARRDGSAGGRARRPAAAPPRTDLPAPLDGDRARAHRQDAGAGTRQ